MKSVKNKKFNLIGKISFGLLSFLMAKSSLAYDFVTDSGLGKTADKAGYPENLNANPKSLLMQGISLTLTFVGVIFLVLLIYSGFIWMNAKGNEQEVDKAKKILTTSIIGLIIVFAAYAISYFVVKYFSAPTLS